MERGVILALASWIIFTGTDSAAGWPMWRCDPGRTAATGEALPEVLHVKWVRKLPPLRPAFRDTRLQFDAGYEPIAFGNRIFIGSNRDDSVTAYDAHTGEELWKTFAEGPVRFAPAGGQGRVFFGSDDGHLYCLRASTGEVLWKFRAIPSDRKLLGNGRLISVWPVRGGPVLQGSRVYFAAGVWPLEGVFVYCLDAASGEVIWLNDRMSFLYGQHPHNTEAFGGLAPQGYLLIEGSDLVVPSSSAYPARVDLATGKLKDFQLPAPGRLPGGWFSATPPAKSERRGLVFDSDVNQKRHEDKPRSEGTPRVRSTILVRDREYRFADGIPGVEGAIHTMLAADGNLIAVTVEGEIHCLGEPSEEGPRRHRAPAQPAARVSPEASSLLAETGAAAGYAVVAGASPSLLGSLVLQSSLRVIALHSGDPPRAALPYPANRLAFIRDTPDTVNLPPWFADLIVLNGEVGAEGLRRLYRSVRPYGGVLAGPGTLRSLAEEAGLEGASVEISPCGRCLIRRSGALPGSTNYTGDWEPSADALVRAPVGVLWFNDRVSHFKRAPQPRFIDGVMVSVDKDWTDASTRSGKVDYRLLEPMFTDVYTGRPFGPDEVPVLRQSFSNVDRKTIQPSQYRPPTQKNDWKPDQPRNGTRVNPLTGLEESRVFPKMYGCDGGLDYGLLYTMRSGTAAFTDKTVESGTINISGPRSGCTNSIIPANGLLNVPYFYEGCTCSYPLPMALSLVSMPESFEQWTSWGHVPADQLAGKIERLGINLGAPGDRKTRDGTLWLEHPVVGGPSPEIRVTTEPEAPDYFYRHSIWMEPESEGRPWVAASGARNLRSIRIEGFKPSRYQVRLVFGQADEVPVAPFSVKVQGVPATASVQPAGPNRGVAVTVPDVDIDDVLTIDFSGPAPLGGIEVIFLP